MRRRMVGSTKAGLQSLKRVGRYLRGRSNILDSYEAQDPQGVLVLVELSQKLHSFMDFID